MASTSTKVGVSALLALGMALLAVFYKRNLDEDILRSRMSAVLDSLLTQETQISETLLPRPRVAIGYGSCTDVFVNAADLLEDVAVPEKPKHYNHIGDRTQLYEMFAYFFQHGAAAERFVSDRGVFDDVVKLARTKEHREAVGGNAPVMALRFSREGADVLLAAKMTETLKRSLPPNVMAAGTSIVQEDDVHLILEYKRNEEWGPYRSPRANRFIIHSDVNNPTVSSLEDFGTALTDFEPDILVVSGLQMMDNFPFPPDVRRDRLRKIQTQMTAQNFAKTRIHFEMASFVEESLLLELAHEVIPYADSLGMNEQELPNLHSILKDGNVSYVSDSNPRIAVVLDQMREIFQMLSVSEYEKGKPRPLTRLHIHTLAYQAIMVKRGSAWKNTRQAAAKASLTANRHVCASTRVDLDKAFIIMDDSFSTSAMNEGVRIPFNESRPVACWTEADLDLEVCIAPNLVCSQAKQTAGGGDNISAAALFPQIGRGS